MSQSRLCNASFWEALVILSYHGPINLVSFGPLLWCILNIFVCPCLQDPLVLASLALPDWCEKLGVPCSCYIKVYLCVYRTPSFLPALPYQTGVRSLPSGVPCSSRLILDNSTSHAQPLEHPGREAMKYSETVYITKVYIQEDTINSSLWLIHTAVYKLKSILDRWSINVCRTIVIGPASESLLLSSSLPIDKSFNLTLHTLLLTVAIELWLHRQTTLSPDRSCKQKTVCMKDKIEDVFQRYGQGAMKEFYLYLLLVLCKRDDLHM